MTAPDSGRPSAARFHRVEDATQARLLVDPTALRYFRPFLARDASIAEVARETGLNPDALRYRVGTFLRAGLLTVVRERPRAGRPIKIYRSRHDAYLIPYARTPHASLEEAFAATYDGTIRRIARAQARRFEKLGWDGQRLYRDAGGETWLEGAPEVGRGADPTDPERPLGYDFAIDVRLTDAEARALQDGLLALLGRYRSHAARDRQDGAGHRYLVMAAFVPVGDEG